MKEITSHHEVEPYAYTINGVTLYVENDKTNCKLSFLNGVGSLKYYSDKEIEEIIDTVLEKLRGCVIINTTNKDLAEKISSIYDTYYFNEVPIGYNGGYQYHFAIRNPINVNDHCREPEKIKKFNNLDDNLKIKIKKEIKAKLKKLRRKDDYVDGLFDE